MEKFFLGRKMEIYVFFLLRREFMFLLCRVCGLIFLIGWNDVGNVIMFLFGRSGKVYGGGEG